MLRIEDIDGPRVKMGAAEELIETLAWLGIDWDEGPTFQSEDLSAYREAMRVLASRGRVFACALSRREIEQASSAPHAGEGETRFDASMRPVERSAVFEDENTNWRFIVDGGVVTFEDAVHGHVRTDVGASVGDFVVWTKRGLPAYQLAVVVDDARQGVTQVVRGDDLIESTGRQMLLYEALGLGLTPRYAHLGLVVGPDGRRLAKRHGDTRVSTYRKAGVGAERIVALMARWCGMGERASLGSAEFAEGFDLARMTPGPTVMTPEDDRWLMASARA